MEQRFDISVDNSIQFWHIHGDTNSERMSECGRQRNCSTKQHAGDTIGICGKQLRLFYINSKWLYRHVVVEQRCNISIDHSI